MTYQIVNWDANFENFRSRERDRCSFVCVPNKQSGLGFCRIMAEADGAAIYGIWHCILGACSQQKQPRNGWLTDTGRPPAGYQAGSGRVVAGYQAGIPWVALDLALKFRRPVPEVEMALAVLCSVSIGWIALIDDYPASIGALPADYPPTTRPLPADYPGREGKEGKEGKGMEPTNFPTLEQAVEFFTESESGYDREEVSRAYNSFAATVQDGFWFVGQRRVSDWRSAMSMRMEDSRSRKPFKKKELGYQP